MTKWVILRKYKSMDPRLQAISAATQEIGRNLLSLQTTTDLQTELVEEALETINQFEAGEMHALRVAMENI